MPLAAGENIASRAGFQQALGGDVLRVVQPDIAKWGGLSVCSGIARDIMKSGKTFCPHYLGGGIGLLASAHLLAGVGGDGLLEVDSNDNPLRDRFCGPVARYQRRHGDAGRRSGPRDRAGSVVDRTRTGRPDLAENAWPRRDMTTSSSAPDRPAAWSRTACPPIRPAACCCWKPAGPTAISGSSFRSATTGRSTTSAFPACSRPSRARPPAAVRSSGRAAACSADRRRSMA